MINTRGDRNLLTIKDEFKKRSWHKANAREYELIVSCIKLFNDFKMRVRIHLSTFFSLSNTCAMIGKFSGPYFTLRLLKFKRLSVLKSSSSILNSEI